MSVEKDIEKEFTEIIMKYNKEMKGIRGIWLINEKGEILATYSGFTNFSLNDFLRIVDKMDKIYKEEVEEIILNLGGFSIYSKKIDGVFFIASFLYRNNLGFLRLMAQDIEENYSSSREDSQ